MVTIKDIAQMAGVSAMTVSNVIHNRSAKMSDETRSKIKSLLEEHNYKPNTFARTLVSGTSKLLGLIIPDAANPYYAGLIRAVEEAANLRGYGVFLCHTRDSETMERQYVNALIENSVDGLIIAGSSISGTEFYNDLAQAQFPVVMMDRMIHEEDSIYGLIADDYTGSRLAVEHLANLGHSKIGCITGPTTAHGYAERIRGYIDQMRNCGLSDREKWIRTERNDIRAGYEAAEQLLADDVTAIYACSDILAYGVYRFAKEQGLVIPDSLSVIGFGDIPFSNIISPGLTSISQPVSEMGQQAAQLLLDLIDQTNTPQKLSQQLSALKIRESTSRNL